MSYRIIIQPTAEVDIDAIFRFLASASRPQAESWFNGISESILSLRQMPGRCGIARESPHFDEPIRQLIYGRRNQAYRVIFVIRGNIVRVLRVLHGAHDAISEEELDR